MAHVHDIKCLEAGPGGKLVCKYEREHGSSQPTSARVCQSCKGSGLGNGHVCQECGGAGEVRGRNGNGNGNGNGGSRGAKIFQLFGEKGPVLSPSTAQPVPPFPERAKPHRTLEIGPHVVIIYKGKHGYFAEVTSQTGAGGTLPGGTGKTESEVIAKVRALLAGSSPAARPAPPVQPEPERSAHVGHVGLRYAVYPIRGFLPAAIRAEFLTPKAAIAASGGLDPEHHAVYEVVPGMQLSDPRSKGRLAVLLSREGSAIEAGGQVGYYLSTPKALIPGHFKIRSGAMAFAREHFRQHPKIPTLTLHIMKRGEGTSREILKREDFVGGPQPPEYVIFKNRSYGREIAAGPFKDLPEAKRAAERLLAEQPELEEVEVRKRVPGDLNYYGHHATTIHRKRAASAALTEMPADLSADSAARIIRAALKLRSGKDWSVTAGTGTARSWLKIDAPPKDRVWNWDGTEREAKGTGYMSRDRRIELGNLLGLGKPVHPQGESIAASRDHWREYVARAQGRTPPVIGQQYWD